MIVPGAMPTSATDATTPPFTRISVPPSASRRRVRSTKWDTDAMLGSASPRNPIVRMASRSSTRAILLVA